MADACDIRFDVIVIGDGMAGLCCAGELVLQGARVLLLLKPRRWDWL
jgi:glycine/D-amino acid oxidase-like deaminating enzyme